MVFCGDPCGVPHLLGKVTRSRVSGEPPDTPIPLALAPHTHSHCGSSSHVASRPQLGYGWKAGGQGFWKG